MPAIEVRLKRIGAFRNWALGYVAVSFFVFAFRSVNWSQVGMAMWLGLLAGAMTCWIAWRRVVLWEERVPIFSAGIFVLGMITAIFIGDFWNAVGIGALLAASFSLAGAVGVEIDCRHREAEARRKMAEYRPSLPIEEQPIIGYAEQIAAWQHLAARLGRKHAAVVEKATTVSWGLADRRRPAAVAVENLRGPISPPSKIGGRPHVPGDFDWPVYRDECLSFLAQVNLAEVERVHPEDPLPADGVLSFFYAYGSDAWGHSRDEAGAIRVFYFPAQSVFQTATPPRTLGPRSSFREKWVRPVIERMTEGLDDESAAGKALNAIWEKDRETCRRAFWCESHGHVLLGPWRIPEEFVEDGIRGATSAPDVDDEESRQRAISMWRPLLHFDADEAGFAWGDGGSLTFMMREEDLTAHRWDAVWWTISSH